MSITGYLYDATMSSSNRLLTEVSMLGMVRVSPSQLGRASVEGFFVHRVWAGSLPFTNIRQQIRGTVYVSGQYLTRLSEAQSGSFNQTTSTEILRQSWHMQPRQRDKVSWPKRCRQQHHPLSSRLGQRDQGDSLTTSKAS